MEGATRTERAMRFAGMEPMRGHAIDTLALDTRNGGKLPVRRIVRKSASSEALLRSHPARLQECEWPSKGAVGVRPIVRHIVVLGHTSLGAASPGGARQTRSHRHPESAGGSLRFHQW